MKKVYAVIDEDSRAVYGIFSTCEKAMKYLGKLKLEEELSDEELEEMYGLYIYEVDKEK